MFYVTFNYYTVVIVCKNHLETHYYCYDYDYDYNDNDECMTLSVFDGMNKNEATNKILLPTPYLQENHIWS